MQNLCKLAAGTVFIQKLKCRLQVEVYLMWLLEIYLLHKQCTKIESILRDTRMSIKCLKAINLLHSWTFFRLLELQPVGKYCVFQFFVNPDGKGRSYIFFLLLFVYVVLPWNILILKYLFSLSKSLVIVFLKPWRLLASIYAVHEFSV